MGRDKDDIQFELEQVSIRVAGHANWLSEAINLNKPFTIEQAQFQVRDMMEDLETMDSLLEELSDYE